MMSCSQKFSSMIFKYNHIILSIVLSMESLQKYFHPKAPSTIAEYSFNSTQ